MRTCAFLLLGAALALGGGCSNDSGTSGPQVFPVELTVSVQEGIHKVQGATVQVLNMSTVTNNEGVADFHTDINTLIPTYTYQITVISSLLIQATPERDTVIVPRELNTPTGYVLGKTVQMKPKGEP